MSTFLAGLIADVVYEDVEVLGREFFLGLFSLLLVGELDESVPGEEELKFLSSCLIV